MRWRFKRRHFIGLAIGVLGPAFLFFWMHFRTLHSEPYEAALRFVSENQVLVQRLGSPIKARLKPLGAQDWTYDNERGRANLELLVRGTARSGTVHLRLTKVRALWAVTDATLQLPNQKGNISILQPTGRGSGRLRPANSRSSR